MIYGEGILLEASRQNQIEKKIDDEMETGVILGCIPTQNLVLSSYLPTQELHRRSGLFH